MLRIVPALALGLIRALDSTWRYRETGREHLDAVLADGNPAIMAFLHGRTFTLLRHMTRAGNGQWISMCSKSLDGEAMARIEERLRKAWDRTLLPKPFARVDIVYGRPIDVPSKLDAAGAAALTAEVEQQFVALQQEADTLSGFGDDEPVRAPA